MKWMGLDVVFVDGGLHFVRQEHHDQIGHLGGFRCGNRLEAVLLGQLIVGAAGALAHHDLHAGVAQILGMGMALAAVADDGHRFVFQHTEICVFVIIYFHGSVLQRKLGWSHNRGPQFLFAPRAPFVKRPGLRRRTAERRCRSGAG